MLVQIQGWSPVGLLVILTDRTRLRNKAKLKPMELVDPRNTQLRSTLQRAEFAMTAGDDIIQDNGDEGPTGSASDSE